MKIGYVRVSTLDQNTIRQEVMMEQLKVEKIFIDRSSGKNINRPQLLEMMDFVREGDTVIVESISRFARSTMDFLSLVDQLKDKRVEFTSLKESIDTSTSQGRFVMTIFAALAELERENILERQREGIECAKAAGKYKGRPPKVLENWVDVYERWKGKKITAADASMELGLSRSSFYRKVFEYEYDKTEEKNDKDSP